MSCGQIPEKDDICAGDRLGQLLNRARVAAREVVCCTPSDAPATLQPQDGEPAGERLQGCSDDEGGITPSLSAQEHVEVWR